MNIALFSPNRNPYSETFIQAHKRHLKGTVFYYYGQRGNILLEDRSHKITFKQQLYLKYLEKIKYIGIASKQYNDALIKMSLLNNEIDVILFEYGHHAHHLLDITQEVNIPFVAHFHGFDATVKKRLESFNNYKEMFSKAAKVVVVSEAMRQQLISIGCPEEKLAYTVCGPQPEFELIQPSFEKKQLIAVGRYTNKKAPYYLLLSMVEVVKKHPDAILLIAGDGELYNTCHNLINYFNLTKNVLLLGVIDHKLFKEELSQSRAFVQHSITALSGDMEGTPVSVLEASIAGVPVISTYHAGIKDVIIHEKSGLLSEEHDVINMAKHMCMLLDDRELAVRLGAFGKKNTLENFSMKKTIGKLDAILEEAIKID